MIVLGHVRVEVVLPIPDDGRRGGATEEHAGEDGALDGELVENGEAPGRPRQVGQVWVFGSSAKEVSQPQNILVFVLIWQ